MKRTRRHDIAGAILDVPLRYDARTQMDIEEYPDLIKYPLYTPAGERVMLTIEDACDLGETADGVQCIDCGSCVYYRQAPDSLLGGVRPRETPMRLSAAKVKTSDPATDHQPQKIPGYIKHKDKERGNE